MFPKKMAGTLSIPSRPNHPGSTADDGDGDEAEDFRFSSMYGILRHSITNVLSIDRGNGGVLASL